MNKFKPGDVVYHKATNKKCVVSSVDGDKVYVTTQDDEKRIYKEWELMLEQEWLAQNQNLTNSEPLEL